MPTDSDNTPRPRPEMRLAPVGHRPMADALLAASLSSGPRKLEEHIGDALLAAGERVRGLAGAAGIPEDFVIEWIEATAHRLEIEPHVELTGRKGRPDTRSMRLDVYVVSQRPEVGRELLVSVRVRDLLDEHGKPVDAQAMARELMGDEGMVAPDSLAGLDDLPPAGAA